MWFERSDRIGIGKELIMDVSIIIISWNTKELLRECLKSIFEHVGEVDYEVIVVDNASTDGSPEMVKDDFPQITLIENSRNSGYAAACNQGIKATKSKYVLLLNSDILICDTAIEKVVRYADKHPQVGVIGCQVWESKDEIMMTCFRFPSVANLFLSASGLSRLFKHNRILGREQMRWWDRKSERQVDVVPGVFMLVRREAIDQVGFLDEEFFFYSEEVDWCYRFSKVGWTTMFWPDAKIIHIGGGGQSSRKTPVKAYVNLVKGKLRYFKKHHSFINYLFARAILFVLFVIKYCLWSIASIAALKRGGDTNYRLQRQKAWWAIKFTAFGLEPKENKIKLASLLLKQVIEIINFTVASIYSFTLSFARKETRRIIIYYHGISHTDVISFARQMAYLAEKCCVVKPSMIKDTQADGSTILIAITFDDAFVSFRENALPLLKEYGLSAGVFVPTGNLGRKPGWAMARDCLDSNEVVMNEQQIVELSRDGFEILSHTVSHPLLTEIDDDRLQKELIESKRELQKIIGHEISGISYPYGAYDVRVCDAAKRAGYQLGFTIEPQIIDCSSDDMTIGRFKVSPGDSLIKFRLKVNGGYAAVKYLSKLKGLLKRRAPIVAKV